MDLVHYGTGTIRIRYLKMFKFQPQYLPEKWACGACSYCLPETEEYDMANGNNNNFNTSDVLKNRIIRPCWYRYPVRLSKRQDIRPKMQRRFFFQSESCLYEKTLIIQLFDAEPKLFIFGSRFFHISTLARQRLRVRPVFVTFINERKLSPIFL